MGDTTNMQPQPLDVHAAAMAEAYCGQSLSTWSIARRLRGIGAIAMVLSAESSQSLNLGDHMRAGLIEAIQALTDDASSVLDDLSDNIKTGQYLPK